jgi:hypothetical protein
MKLKFCNGVEKMPDFLTLSQPVQVMLALTYLLSLAESENFDQFLCSQSVTSESHLINQSTWLF